MSGPLRDVPDRPADPGLFACWWAMIEAHHECAGLPPIDDNDLVLHFNGSGASCMVFAKDIRAAIELINETKAAS